MIAFSLGAVLLLLFSHHVSVSKADQNVEDRRLTSSMPGWFASVWRFLTYFLNIMCLSSKMCISSKMWDFIDDKIQAGFLSG
uniref:Secreted protein n=1 Tax=Trichobilharzia regenti TaxID=157069 RepID=A0AA85IVL4_TRIRE|nr:unnamed protein product [Trichobilharzia regenti]